MDVPSYLFLAFAAAVAVVINISPAPKWRKGVLFFANLAFIGSFAHNPWQLLPFAGLLVLGYASVRMVETNQRRGFFIALLILAIVVFCWLKRYAFIPHALFLPGPYVIVGMSYVFFRILHLVIDAYQKSLPAAVTPLNYINYTLNFTALVSGPIQLYGDYLRTESKTPLPIDLETVGLSFRRIVLGFVKVTIVSPLLYFTHEQCLGLLPSAATFIQRVGCGALLLSIFPVYIYFNFSGYMDVVIGTARLLRLELPENFNRPFISRGFIEFWNRWHMTLSTWIKTYVYSPLLLSLMRRYPTRSVEPWLGIFAYFVAFFVIGVWHGQTSMFIFLGVLLGLGVSMNKLYQLMMIRRLGRGRYQALCDNFFYAAISRGLTFSWFAFCSLWFWATWQQLGALAGILTPLGMTLAFFLLLVGATLSLAVLKDGYDLWLGATAGRRWRGASSYALAAWYTSLAVLVVSVSVLLNAPAPHIIYRGF